MSTYTALLKTPGVARVIAAQLTARFPFGMLSLAFLLHVEHVHHNYTAAGLVLAATSLGLGFVAILFVFKFRSFKEVIQAGKEARAAEQAPSP